MFEATLEQVVALAILMPVVASMGGIAGTQALTIVIRGMALGRVGSANIRALVSREVLIGTANGLFWSLVVGFAAFLWFGDFTLGYVIALAIIVNLIVAAVVGTLLPGYLKSLQIDPALAAMEDMIAVGQRLAMPETRDSASHVLAQHRECLFQPGIGIAAVDRLRAGCRIAHFLRPFA